MSVYVLVDDDKPAYFKIGRSSRTRERLLRDYLRGNPRIRVISWNECDSVPVERETLARLGRYRVRNCRGRLSEWVTGVDERAVLKVMRGVIKEHVSAHLAALAAENTRDLYDKTEYDNELGSSYINTDVGRMELLPPAGAIGIIETVAGYWTDARVLWMRLPGVIKNIRG